ncbi:hypothetical protein GJAV_G00142820 [Gymnothorax javanicus]|nr:hypothetical protein GJAV_G00142820 [Gymnothorax javanicus]
MKHRAEVLTRDGNENERVTAVMGPLWCLLYLLPFSPILPCYTQQSLRCLNDFINNVTCVWDSRGVSPDAVCTLRGVYPNKRKPLIGVKGKCELKPLNERDPAMRGCHFVFEKRKFGYGTKIQINVNCENVTNHELPMMDFKPCLNIKMNPPGTPTISNYTISWSPGEPFSELLHDTSGYIFQLQYKQEGQLWQDVDLTNIMDKTTQTQLSEEYLEKGVRYQVRVRVRVDPDNSDYEGEWSSWSPITSWRSEVGREPPSTGDIKRPADVGMERQMMIGCGAALLVLLVAVSLTIPMRKMRVYNTSPKPVPNPSKYFDVLNSIHGGNLQKWLNPAFSSQFFDIIQYSEDISRLEVFSAGEDAALCRRDMATAGKVLDTIAPSPCFCNLSYFYPSYPGEQSTLPLCSHSQPAEGAVEQESDSRALTTSSTLVVPSYKCLQTLLDGQGEPEHPDSGIGVGSEDQDSEDEGEDRAEDGVWKSASDIHSDSSAFLPFLLPKGRSTFHAAFPQHLPGFPPFPSSLFPLPNPGEGGLLEPCDDGYKPVTEIQNSIT